LLGHGCLVDRFASVILWWYGVLDAHSIERVDMYWCGADGLGSVGDHSGFADVG
jgi:hypothetical protein